MCFNKYKYKRIWCENIERLTLVYRIIIDWSLQTNCIDILISSLLFDFNNDVLINSGVDQVRKLVKADKMAFIVLGFITRLPFRAMRRMLLFWPTDCRKRQSPVLCLHTPFPHGYTVSRVGCIICFPSGGFSRRCYATPQNDIKCVARKTIRVPW